MSFGSYFFSVHFFFYNTYTLIRINCFSVILEQPNYCEYPDRRIETRKVRKVHINPHYRPKKGKGKKNMPVFDFALIEVRRDLDLGKKVQQNGWQLFQLVICYV